MRRVKRHDNFIEAYHSSKQELQQRASLPINNFLKSSFFVELLVFHGHPLRYPASESVEVNVAVGAWEVIAAHHLHVGLLNEGYPELILVIGKRTEELVVAADGKLVVNDHLASYPIDVEFDHVFATGVVNRVTIAVFGVYYISNESLFELLFVESTYSNGRDKRAVRNAGLNDTETVDDFYHFRVT